MTGAFLADAFSCLIYMHAELCNIPNSHQGGFSVASGCLFIVSSNMPFQKCFGCPFTSALMHLLSMAFCISATYHSIKKLTFTYIKYY